MKHVRTSLNERQLALYLSNQLNHFFKDGNDISVDEILTFLPATLERVDICFRKISNKYFFDGNHVMFNHLHSDQYSMFLYLAANTAYRMGLGKNIASKIFLLNKTLNGIDAFYEVELPEVFLFVHPLGTVLGRAKYKNYLLVYQGCGVGSNSDIYPELEEFVTLRPGSFVLGNSKIGKNCSIAAKSLIIDKDLAANTVYFGTPSNFRTKVLSEAPLPIWRI